MRRRGGAGLLDCGCCFFLLLLLLAASLVVAASCCCCLLLLLPGTARPAHGAPFRTRPGRKGEAGVAPADAGKRGRAGGPAGGVSAAGSRWRDPAGSAGRRCAGRLTVAAGAPRRWDEADDGGTAGPATAGPAWVTSPETGRPQAGGENTGAGSDPSASFPRHPAGNAGAGDALRPHSDAKRQFSPVASAGFSIWRSDRRWPSQIGTANGFNRIRLTDL